MKISGLIFAAVCAVTLGLVPVRAAGLTKSSDCTDSPNPDSTVCFLACTNSKDVNPNLVIAACSRFIQLAPWEVGAKATALSKRALAYVDISDTDDAIKDADAAVNLEPENPVHRHVRAIAYAAAGDFDRAIANWDQAISLNPTFANYYNQRGKAWSAKGDSDRARADYAKAMELEAKK